MGLIAVAKPGTVMSAAAVAGWEDAMEAAPPAYFDKSSVMLPEVAHEGTCRLCGAHARLTREHIPPQSVGNKGQYRSFSFQDWLNKGEGDLDLGGGEPGQGGVWGYTLCKPCNDLTGHRYGAEYKAWAARAADLLGRLPGPVEQDQRVEPFGIEFGLGGASDGGVAPGDFIRQVLSLMCSLSGGWDLAGRHPEIRQIVLDRACHSLPGRMEVHLALCWGPRSRMVGPQLMIDADSGEWAWVMELSYPPLALLMVLDSNHEVRSRGVDISPFTEVAPRERKSFETIGQVLVGFTWSIYPWDFRSSAALGVEPPLGFR